MQGLCPNPPPPPAAKTRSAAPASTSIGATDGDQTGRHMDAKLLVMGALLLLTTLLKSVTLQE